MIGLLTVWVVGVLWHFVYEWSGNNEIIGLIAPINESVWEHIKLLYFPMLFYTIFMAFRLEKSHPCILTSFITGNIIGSALIPSLFYLYTSVTGTHYLWADIALFFIAVAVAFFVGYRLTLSCKLADYELSIILLAAAFCLMFFVYTYFPPDFEIFRV